MVHPGQTVDARYLALRLEALAKAEALVAALRSPVPSPDWGHVGSMAHAVNLIERALPHAGA